MLFLGKNLKKATMRKTSSKTISLCFLQDLLRGDVPLSLSPFLFYRKTEERRPLTSHISLRTCNGDWTPWRNAKPKGSKSFQMDCCDSRRLWRIWRISLQDCKQRSRIPRRILSETASRLGRRCAHPSGSTWDVGFLVSILFSTLHWNDIYETGGI